MPGENRQSVDRLFSHESVARIGPKFSEVKGACFDTRATEAPSRLNLQQKFHINVYVYSKNKICKTPYLPLWMSKHHVICGIDESEHEGGNSEVYFWLKSVDSVSDENLMPSTWIEELT